METKKNETMEMMEIEAGKYREMRDTLAQRIRCGDTDGALELLAQLDEKMEKAIGPDVKIILNGGLVQSVYADKVIGVEVLDLDWPEFPTDEDRAEMEEVERKADAVAADPAYDSYY